MAIPLHRGMIAALVFFAALQPSLLHAAATLRIDQSKLRFVLPSGGAKSGQITIDNPTDRIVQVKVYTEDWRYTSARDGTKEFFPPGITPYSCSKWLAFSPDEFTMSPFGRQTVNYTVTVPADAQGGHVAVVFFESSLGETPREDIVGMNLVVRIGVLFFVEPEGTVSRRADIDGLSVTSTKQDPLALSVLFKNAGTVDLFCAATYDIIDAAGKVFARGAFNDAYTLPGDEATLRATWSEPLKPGTYDLVLTLDMSKLPGQEMPLPGEVITKEASLVIGPGGTVIKTGELK